MGERIKQWKQDLSGVHGRGFVLVRGLPVGEEAAAVLFWGLGQHLGVPGAQNNGRGRGTLTRL